MNAKKISRLRYSKELEQILLPRDYRKIAISIIVGVILSGSQGTNTDQDPLCAIGPKYSKIAGTVIEILDCKTGVIISRHDISTLLFQNPLKNSQESKE